MPGSDKKKYLFDLQIHELNKYLLLYTTEVFWLFAMQHYYCNTYQLHCPAKFIHTDEISVGVGE